MKNNVLPSCYNQCCHAECAYYVGPAARARLRYSFIRMCIYIYIYVWHEDEKPGRREEKAYGVGPAAPARPP